MKLVFPNLYAGFSHQNLKLADLGDWSCDNWTWRLQWQNVEEPGLSAEAAILEHILLDVKLNQTSRDEWIWYRSLPQMLINTSHYKKSGCICLAFVL